MDTNFLSIVVSQVENKCGLNFINQKFTAYFSVGETKTHKTHCLKGMEKWVQSVNLNLKQLKNYSFWKKCHWKRKKGQLIKIMSIR